MNIKYKIKNRGFTLLEVILALAILTLSLAAIIMAQSSGLRSSEKSKRMNLVVFLARSKMIEIEETIQGKKFLELKKEEKGEFPEPYKEYRWFMKITEPKFPSLFEGQKTEATEESGGAQQLTKFSRLLAKYLSDSLREISVTIEWDQGPGTQSQTITQYWVNLEQPFPISE